MEALSFPRAARLLAPGDFLALRRSGKRLPCRFFHIEYRPSEFDTARLGLAVSRRVSKRAVVRNKIKRQVRESFRLSKADLPAVDILVIARTTAAQQSLEDLRADLAILWRKLTALNTAALNRNRADGTMRADS